MIKTTSILSTFGIERKLTETLIRIALAYQVDITLEYEDFMLESKTLIESLNPEIPSGRNIVLRFQGKDAKQAYNEYERSFK